MKRWLTFLMRRWLINIIHHASHSPEYNRRQYLCPTIKETHSGFTYRWARHEVDTIIGGHSTLYGHFLETIDDDRSISRDERILLKRAYVQGGWQARKDYHMDYWFKVQKALEAGSWDEAIYPDLDKLKARALVNKNENL